MAILRKNPAINYTGDQSLIITFFKTKQNFSFLMNSLSSEHHKLSNWIYILDRQQFKWHLIRYLLMYNWYNPDSDKCNS